MKLWNSSRYAAKSIRSSSGIEARRIAASCTAVMRSEPIRLEAASPSRPFDKFAMMTRCSSIASAIFKVLVACPRMLRTAGAASNAPTLFCTGENTSAANCPG